jgi:hypothetical protein
MDRAELEREVLKGLNIQRPCDIPVYESAIRKKTTPELEKVLANMKKAGKW